MMIYFEEESGGAYPNGVVHYFKTGITYRIEFLSPNEPDGRLLAIVQLIAPQSTSNVGRELCRGASALSFWRSLISCVPYYDRSPFDLLRSVEGTSEQEAAGDSDIPF